MRDGGPARRREANRYTPKDFVALGAVVPDWDDAEAQVEGLLRAPNLDAALGLRDRTMIELMYASGLRVSELVTLKTVEVGLNEGVVRVLGKGSKERLIPFGEEAHGWLTRYLRESRPALLGARSADALFVPATGQAVEL